jgi:hypothetical protein
MTTSDPVASAARAAAQHLAADYGPGLAADVEAELYARNSTAPKLARFIDPISVAGLIVAIATLAWTVYNDLRTKTANPAPETVARGVRIRLRERGESRRAEADRITEIVVTEITRPEPQPG